MKFILGKKLEMTQIFHDDGRVIPVTAVLAEPNIVTQVKTEEKDKYNSIQVGFGVSKVVKKSRAGHLKGLDQVKVTREFRVDPADVEKIKRGDKITINVFENNDVIKVTGVSKGKGFQGVVKRHGFHGSPASHGHKDQLRMPGSIGATDPARVFKGTRMAGRMGADQVTISGLSVAGIDLEKNIIYIKGAIPGARNGLLLISAPGEMDLTIPEPEVKEVKTEEIVEAQKEEVKEETPVEEKVEMPAQAEEIKEDNK